MRRRLMGSLFGRLGIASGSTVLDVGFGNSSELFTISNPVGREGTVYGVELDKSRPRTALWGVRENVNTRVMLGHSCRIPLPSKSVDFVLFKGVLREVKVVSLALGEAARVCRSSGKIVIVDLTFPENWLKRSNLKLRWQHPWRILAPPADKHASFSRAQLFLVFGERMSFFGEV